MPKPTKTLTPEERIAELEEKVARLDRAVKVLMKKQPPEPKPEPEPPPPAKQDKRVRSALL